MTVIMIIYLIIQLSINKRRIKHKMPRDFIYLFVLFIIMAAFALVANGDYKAFDYTKLVLANYLNCVVTFFAIDFFVDDHKAQKKVLLFICILISIDAIITIFQHFGNPIGQAIAFALTTSAEYKETMLNNADLTRGVLFGKELPVGFLGYVHTNATYLATMGLIPLLFFLTSHNVILKGINGFFTFLCLYACYCTQERAAAFLFLLTALAIIYYSLRGKSFIIIFIIALIILFIIMILSSMLSEGDLGRLSNLNDESNVRKTIFEDAFKFVPNHLLFGGPVEFSRINQAGGHNIFLNGLINFGIIGSLVGFYLYFRIIFESCAIFKNNRKIIIKGFAGSILVYSGICLFHNASIISGDTLIFLMYPLFLKALVIEKKYKSI